jgi:hydrogenase maturation factor
MMQRLLDAVFRPHFANPALDAADDGALLTAQGGRIAFTTDSYVVQPLFFRGGSIGDLAVNGTVNDLAMCGRTRPAVGRAAPAHLLTRDREGTRGLDTGDTGTWR